MPKQIVRNEFFCIYCGEKGPKFPDEISAKEHEEFAHDIIYIPMERKELQGLLNFIVLNEKHQELLSEKLMKKLFKFTRGAGTF